MTLASVARWVTAGAVFGCAIAGVWFAVRDTAAWRITLALGLGWALTLARTKLRGD